MNSYFLQFIDRLDTFVCRKHLLSDFHTKFEAPRMKYLSVALARLDAGLHTEVEGGDALALHSGAIQQRQEVLQVRRRLALHAVGAVQQAAGELVRVQRGDEGLHQLQRPRLHHLLLHLAVGCQHGDGQAGMEADELVLLGEGQREEPLGRLLLDHLPLAAVAAVHGAVGQRHGAVPQHCGVGASAPEEQRVQSTVGDQVDRRLLAVFEHVLQDPGNAASQLGVLLLPGQVEDHAEAHPGQVVSVDTQAVELL